MIPAARLLYLLLGWLVAGLLPLFWPQWQLLWLIPGALIAVAALIDALLGWRVPALTLTRSQPHIWAQGRWHTVTLTLGLPSGRALYAQLFDHAPTSWQSSGLPLTPSQLLRAGQAHQLGYQLMPPARGNFDFGRCEARIDSPLRLWQRHVWLGETESVRVFPDFARILQRGLHATDTRLPLHGAIRRRRRGEGTDFHQLREFRQGDSLRAVDWKATARFSKPISREYQEERDQQIIFLLDCSRRMLAQDDERSHFDHALDAMLLLAWTAQKQGDSVGVYAFGDGEDRWLPPQKGRGGVDRLLQGVYDLQPSLHAPDFIGATERLLQHVRKRSFIVLLTSLHDEDEDSLSSALQLLKRRHLCVCASTREVALDQALQTPVTSFPQALRYAGSVQFLQQRQQALARLALRSRALLDATPQELPGKLVSHYLQAKAAGTL